MKEKVSGTAAVARSGSKSARVATASTLMLLDWTGRVDGLPAVLHSKSGNSRPSGVENVREYQIKFAKSIFLCVLLLRDEKRRLLEHGETRVFKNLSNETFF